MADHENEMQGKPSVGSKVFRFCLMGLVLVALQMIHGELKQTVHAASITMSEETIVEVASPPRRRLSHTEEEEEETFVGPPASLNNWEESHHRRLSKTEAMDRRDPYGVRPLPVDFEGENLATIKGMRKLFNKGKKKHEDLLKERYGDWIDKMFPFDTDGRSALDLMQSPGKISARDNANVQAVINESNTPGQQYFVDKLKLKLVQVQLKFLDEKKPKTTLSRFIHVHGGHSTAAGHGNLYKESYTAQLEMHMQPVFQSIGINYVGRNMAAGGTRSGDEMALCSSSVFGRDIDLSTHDYGMTDGRSSNRPMMYAVRLATLSQLPRLSNDVNDIPVRPVLMLVNGNRAAMVAYHELEMANLTTVGHDDWGVREALAVLPDCSTMTEADIQKLPRFIRYFKCGDKMIEKGEPCMNDRWSVPACPFRAHKSNWHPGWKWHALQGASLAIGFVAALEEAMNQLEALEPPNESKDKAKARLTELFNQLNDAEQKRYDDYFQRPGSHVRNKKGGGKWDWLQGVQNEVSLKELTEKPNFCHIIKMPSDQRLRGLTHEEFDKFTVHPKLERNFEPGFKWDKVFYPESANGTVKFQNPKGRENEFLMTSTGYEKCEELTFLDNRDNYYLSNLHGWRELTLPNDSEQKFYSEWDPKNAIGYLMICFTRCSWNRCAADNVRPGNTRVDPESGRLELTVNGVPATQWVFSEYDCHMVGHDGDGKDKWLWTPNKDGKYKIRARVVDGVKHGYVQFSSFIFW